MKFSLPGTRSNLYFAVLVANIASTAVGTHYTWSSPTITKLQQSDSWLPLNYAQASWIVSLTPLGTVFGPFLGGWLVNKVGRRWTIMISVLINMFAWIVLLLSNTLWLLYAGKIIGGVGGGIIFLACPMYVAEISEPHVRDALGSLFSFFLEGGFLMQYIIGPYVSYSALIIINFIPSIVFILLFSIIPESPYYFLRTEDRASAHESLIWLRTGRGSDQVRKEVNRLQVQVRRSMAKKATLSDLIMIRGNRMGLLISFGMVAGQQFSGVNVVLSYGQSIFIMAGSSFSSSVSTIIIGVILFVGGGFAVPLVKLYGMKKIFIASATGMAIFQFILGIYFYFNGKGTDMSAFSWLPVTCLVGLILMYTVGFGPLPWAVIAEMFPSNLKGLASAIATSFCWFLGFLLTKFFKDISEILGTQAAFFLYAVCCFFALIFTIFVLPDTRGMTLQEILNLLNKWPHDDSDEEDEQTHHVDTIRK